MSHRIGGSLCVLVLVVVLLVFSESQITGLATLAVFEKEIDFVVDASQSFGIKSKEGMLRLISLSVEGEVVGLGNVEIVLDNKNGGRRRVFVNNETAESQKTRHGVNAPVEVYGEYMLAGQPEKSASPQSGMFVSCGDACSLPGWEAKEYGLKVYVDAGTRVILKKIVYMS